MGAMLAALGKHVFGSVLMNFMLAQSCKHGTLEAAASE